MRRLKFVLFSLAIVTLLTCAPLMAQEATPEAQQPVIVIADPGTEAPIVVESETDSVPGEDEVRDLATTVEDAFVNSAIGTSQIVALFVALVKLIPALKNVTARRLTFLSTLGLSVVIAAATYLGRGVDFQNFLKMFEQLAPLVVQFVTTLVGAGVTFGVAKYFNVPLIGHSRTP